MKLAFILSLLGHMVLITLVLINIPDHPKPFSHVTIIKAYLDINSGMLAKKLTRHDRKNQPHHAEKSNPVASRREVALKINSQTNKVKNQEPQSRHHRNVIVHRRQPNKIKPLLILMHNLINKNKRYPPSALMMGIEGDCEVAFTLYPDKHIENITLLHSSGNVSLDNAALRSVQAISPIDYAQQAIQSKIILHTWVYFRNN
jgi:TonB family protein